MSLNKRNKYNQSDITILTKSNSPLFLDQNEELSSSRLKKLQAKQLKQLPRTYFHYQMRSQEEKRKRKRYQEEIP